MTGDLLSTVTDIARNAQPPPLSDAAADDMLARAVAPAAPVSAARHWRVAAAVAAVAAAAVAVVVLWPGEPAITAAQPTQLTLPSGDELTISPGADFGLEVVTASNRQIALRQGTIEFDVQPVVGDGRFEVRTPHLNVRVVGTVFSVEVDGETSTVKVISGHVEVTADGRKAVLGPGQTIDSERLRASGVALELERVPEPEVQAEPKSEPAVDAPVAVAPAPAPPASLADARQWIVAKKFTRALSEAKKHKTGSWKMVEADALRGLGRHQRAASEYLNAAQRDPALKEAAGYAAAALLFKQLGDTASAELALDQTNADRKGSPIEERARALRLRILVKQGRLDEARPMAAQYAARFPRSSLADWARKLSNADAAR